MEKSLFIKLMYIVIAQPGKDNLVYTFSFKDK